jgi:2-haloacid dehalogenase
LTLCGRYKPFWDLTEDALRFSLRKLRLIESEATVRLLMQEYACLSAFPENLQCLRRLKAHGLPLGILSNGNPAMLEVAIRSSGMQGLFDHVLSADTVRKFKTAPEVYALGPQATGLAARDILFVSSNAWDACCATWFGYSTFWINRADAPPENLGVAPTATGPNMRELLRYLAVSDSPSN